LLDVSARPTQRGADTAKRLLDDAIDFLAESGPRVSLRQIAEGIGTSHAMLIYHFGDKEQLLAEVLRETRKREFERYEAAAAEGSVRDFVWRTWERSIALDDRPFTLLMVELWSSAVREPERYGGLVEGLVEPWVALCAGVLARDGLDPAVARVRARLIVSAMHGLELELIATGDEAAADAALRELLDVLL
jgi:AcrR family transcriptional regulator